MFHFHDFWRNVHSERPKKEKIDIPYRNTFLGGCVSSAVEPPWFAICMGLLHDGWECEDPAAVGISPIC